ncbi:L-threonylcarbamoyladenylate synthase [Pseudogracilibacillus sp. SO30301A]|uniref:L-threonylcarbamoyladenylate synthase n=1 Tax=Pseudogracilibacillus sp. SO30301A TaxID=3098291 RepID=UPI00300E6828
MGTKLLIVEGKSGKKQVIQEAADLLVKGEVVAIPTETVYGLGANARDEAAVDKIFKAKGRPNDNPLIVHVASKEQLFSLVKSCPTYVEKLIDTFSPGPITYVLESSGKIASNVTAGLSTVGLRIPKNEITLTLLEQTNLPIAAPSANLSGKPSPTTAQHVLEDLDGKIAAVLDGGPANVGLESTVVDCTQEIPVILRLGKITPDDIKQVAGEVKLATNITENTRTPKSPGMKYKHYAPDVPLILVQDNNKLQEIIDEEGSKGNRVGVLTSTGITNEIKADQIIILGRDEEEIAAKLYDALRSFKQNEVDIVVCESFPREGVGKAVMDRIERAANKII